MFACLRATLRGGVGPCRNSPPAERSLPGGRLVLYTQIMTHIIQAIYEQGVFRPLEPVELAEHERVSLAIDSTRPAGTPAEEEAMHRQKQALEEALDEAARLPIEGPDDGFSGADHDVVLYDWKE
jgi:predicted DNA-binding antitoxin AbrB/MazE fold protein